MVCLKHRSYLETIFLVLFSTYCTITTGSDDLQDVRLDGPKYIREGDDVRLSCQYDIKTPSLYAVKWYHEADEFYRLLPKEIPPQQVFPKKGINVNVSASDENYVTLTNITQDASGKIKCVVSAEINFKTLEAIKEIIVVSISAESPKILLDQLNYNPGDMVRANCSLGEVSQQANFTWFINNVKVEVEDFKLQRSYKTPNPKDNRIFTSASSITFPLPETNPPAIVSLKCMVKFFDIYKQVTETKVVPRPRRVSMLSTSSDPLTRYNQTEKGSGAFHKVRPMWFLIFTAQATYLILNYLSFLFPSVSLTYV